jgi:hypothetical protein
VTHLGGQAPVAVPGETAQLVRWEQRYLKWLYYVSAGGLAPWIVYLYYAQVRRALTYQVHVLDLGLILAIMAGVLVTARLYARARPAAVLAASFTGTVAFIAAWFRVLSHATRSHWPPTLLLFLGIALVLIVLCVIVISSEFSVQAGGGPRSRWLPAALVAAALVLIPCAVVVTAVIPAVQASHHLRVAWTGLDVFEFLGLAATGVALDRRSPAVTVPATITGALLLCDAWINIIPTQGMAHAEALVLAFAEVPMAALSFWVAARAVRRPATAAGTDAPLAPGSGAGIAPGTGPG